MHKRQPSTSSPISDSVKSRPFAINPQTDAQTNTPSRVKAKLPNRTTKISQKLTLFPEEYVPQVDEIGETYDQIDKIPEGTARIEAEKFSREERDKLPRVTAYCTASAYQLDDLMKCFQSRRIQNSTAPKRMDECPFSLQPPQSPPTANLLGIEGSERPSPFEQTIPEVCIFEYGVVVIWGMTEQEEQQLLRELMPFEENRLAINDIVTEEFHYHYAASYQPRIYNDIITLKNPGNYMVKLTISHAVAQSVKMTFFEELIEDTIESTKHIPKTMAETGSVQMSRTAITKKIGQLFIMRININLVSNILDTPEIFWSEPAYEELYKAIRGYLEISHRVELLNQRVGVISDLLDMLKDHLTSTHSEQLEWIIIVLIVVEIIVGLMTIFIESLAYSVKKGTP
ncbi:5318_t:CDS:10 [Ambispora gerdemannii]|uniref:5318_t:CDS:1 n=1 Tax=Ambispora gerdemannii TaxID=144530 RepID=A0A9N9F520_9GLOM|nr:5318_t:CDS:10 [Ambispora gerdemannii]